jgi:hypothetical protein
LIVLGHAFELELLLSQGTYCRLNDRFTIWGQTFAKHAKVDCVGKISGF